MRQRSDFRNTAEYLGAKAMLACVAAAPFTARWFVWLLDKAIPRLRRTALRNLSLTGMPASLVDDSFASLARLLVSLAQFPRINAQNISQWIRYDGFEHFEAGMRKGKGVLFATAHLGNWELSAFAHAILTRPMHVVVRPLDNPKLDALVRRYRTISGNTILDRGDFVRPILRALRNNEAVGILVDQNVAADEGVFVDFFGMKACVGSGFARLAAASGATVLPGFAVWSEAERRYVLRFYPPVEIVGEVVADTQRVQAALESAIREYPGQWLWMHRRWKTRPPGEQALY